MEVSITRERNRTRYTKYILALFVPFVAFVYSLSNRKLESSKNLFWIAIVFMGFVFIYSPEGSEGPDSFRYAKDFKEMHAREDITFSELRLQFFDPATGTVDFFEFPLRYLVSRVTGNPHFYFMTIALIFGFFYSRNMWYVFDRLPEKVGFYIGVALVLFVLTIPTRTIGGIRFATAVHVFVFGALPYVIDNSKRRLLWCAVAPLIHFSFLFAIGILLLYFFVPKKSKIIPILVMVYIGSFLLNRIELPQINEFLKKYVFIESLENRVDRYANEEYAEKLNYQHQEYNRFMRFMITYSNRFVFATVIITFAAWGLWLRKNKTITKMLAFCLFFLSFNNIASGVPSGGRFINVGLLFLLPTYMFMLASIPRQGYNLFRFSTLLWIPSLILAVRMELDAFGITLLTTNFFIAPFVETDIPLVVFIKHLLYM